MSGLLDFLKPDETAAEFLARTHAEPIGTGLFFAASLRPGQVLEISGPSGAAKSEILIQVMRHANELRYLGLHGPCTLHFACFMQVMRHANELRYLGLHGPCTLHFACFMQVSARRLLPRFWQTLPIGGHSGTCLYQHSAGHAMQTIEYLLPLRQHGHLIRVLCCVVRAEHVILYDLDRKFDGIRLYHVLLTHLKNLPGEQQLRCSLIPCEHGPHLANDLQNCRQMSFIQHASHACRGLS